MKQLFAVFLLLASVSMAYAEEGIIKKPLEYDVEIIIFEDANARYLNSEYWRQDAITDVTKNTKVKRNSSNTKQALYKNTKPHILSKEYRRINNSKEYNVLFFGSWRQTGLEEKKAFKINIETLKNNHKVTSKNSLTGNLKLVLARYLHIYSKLKYQRDMLGSTTINGKTVESPDPESSNPESSKPKSSNQWAAEKNKALAINNHRRMRSKELHYIDHPLLGMLIQINPVKAHTKKAP